ncbi:hypothetical protein H4R35_005360 [Dimargaris xerosporica]|nr:hypothetical protein H4R35_005360 [Dimargaris xerosporica]
MLSQPELTAPAVVPAKPKSLHRRRACERCLKSKIKCDGNEPCARCHRLKRACQFGYINRQPPKRSSGCAYESTLSVDTQELSSDGPQPLERHSLYNQAVDRLRELTERLESLMLNMFAAPGSPAWDCSPPLFPPSPSSLASASASPPNLMSSPIQGAAIPQLLKEIESYYHPPQELDSLEQILYHPQVISGLLTTYVNFQARIYRAEYGQRLFQKVFEGKLSPFVLNCVLAVSAPSHDVPFNTPLTPRELGSHYLKRAEEQLLNYVENISLDTFHGITYLSAASYVLNDDDKHVQYSTLLSRTVAKLGLDKIDAPTATTAGSADPLMDECRRRAIWTHIHCEAFVSLLLGTAPLLCGDQIQVDPVDDRLYQQVLTVDPQKDRYPVLTSSLGEMLYGYPISISMVKIMFKISKLRATATCPLNEVVDQYRDLNHQLDRWYDELNQVCLRPDETLTDNELFSNPVHYTACMNMYSSHFMNVVQLNTQHVFAGPDMTRPEDDPECLERGIAAANAFVEKCFPFYKRLPAKYFGYWGTITTFTIALKFVFLLDQATPADRLRYQALIQEFVTLLEHRSPVKIIVQRYCKVIGQLCKPYFELERSPPLLEQPGPISMADDTDEDEVYDVVKSLDDGYVY